MTRLAVENECAFADGPPWTCQRCDWTFARRGEPILSAKPSRRKCPKRITPEEQRARIEQLISSKAAEGTFPRTAAEALANLDICFGGCPALNNGRCTNVTGQPCELHGLWARRLLTLGCPGVSRDALSV